MIPETDKVMVMRELNGIIVSKLTFVSAKEAEGSLNAQIMFALSDVERWTKENTLEKNRTDVVLMEIKQHKVYGRKGIVKQA
jgi:hypothetical protein